MKVSSHGSARYLLLLVAAAVALSAPLVSLRFIAFFVFFLVAAAHLYTRLVVRRIEVRRLDPEVRGTRLQSIPVRIRLRSRLPVPVARIIASERPNRLYCDQPHREATLSRWGEEEWTLSVRSERRGEFHYGPLVLEGCDPFGFFRWERSDSQTARAIIYPRIYSIALANREGVAGGEIPTPHPAYEDVTRFRSLREYVRGDEPKRINWKASAKTGKLFTTEYERALTVGVRIVLDLSADDYPTRRREASVERAIEVAAALIFSYTRLGQPIGLIAAQGAKPPALFPEESGWRHAERMLELLSRVEAEAGSAGYAGLVSAGGGAGYGVRLIFVAPLPTGSQLGELRAVRAGRPRADFIEIPTAREGREGDDAARELAALLRVHRATEGGEVLLEHR